MCVFMTICFNACFPLKAKGVFIATMCVHTHPQGPEQCLTEELLPDRMAGYPTRLQCLFCPLKNLVTNTFLCLAWKEWWTTWLNKCGRKTKKGRHRNLICRGKKHWHHLGIFIWTAFRTFSLKRPAPATRVAAPTAASCSTCSSQHPASSLSGLQRP